MPLLDSLKQAFHHKESPSKKNQSQAPKQQNMAHPAPSSAQQAHYAAYQPQPVAQSMKDDFAGPNPAQGQHEFLGFGQQSGAQSSSMQQYSPGISSSSVQAGQNVDNKEQAAKRESLPAGF